MDEFEKVVTKFGPIAMKDFGISREQTAGMFGNFGGETGGFKHWQEIKPIVPGSRGGFGWAQWTGQRRRDFEAYCNRNNFSPFDHEANYKFLWVELKGPERAALAHLKKQLTVRDATISFMERFERPGIRGTEKRVQWAQRAYRALIAIDAQPAPPVAAPTIPEPPKLERTWIDKLLRLLQKLFGG